MCKSDYDGYKIYLDDLNRREMSNSETYDKALLTLSSAFLGLSLTFTKDVVPFSTAEFMWLLYLSWALFALTIISTIASFIYGQYAIRKLKAGAKSYYLEGNKEENQLSVSLSRQMEGLNTSSGIVFISAVVLLTVFIAVNVSGEFGMNDEKKLEPEPCAQTFQKFDQIPPKAEDNSSESSDRVSKAAGDGAGILGDLGTYITKFIRRLFSS